MSDIKHSPVVPFIPSPVMVDKMIKRGAKLREMEMDLILLKADLAEIAEQRREGLLSKAQAKHIRKECIAKYVAKGGTVKVLDNGAITFA